MQWIDSLLGGIEAAIQWFLYIFFGFLIIGVVLSTVWGIFVERSTARKERIAELEKDSERLRKILSKGNPPPVRSAYLYGHPENWYAIIETMRGEIVSLALDPGPGEPGGVDRLPEDTDIRMIIPAEDYDQSIEFAEMYLDRALAKPPGEESTKQPEGKPSPFSEL